MADYTWPATLPQSPLIDRYQEQPPDIIIRTEMDAGPAKIRRRITDNVRPLQFEMHLTDAQVTILDDFFVTSLSGGVSRFDWTHPRTGESEEFRFVERPIYKAMTDGYWLVNIKLEEMP